MVVYCCVENCSKKQDVFSIKDKEVEDLKVGDYILALFVSTGKRAVVHYKYVAKILQVLEGDDFEVQCLKNLDETKTTFKFIENDQCVIAKKEILRRLPDP
ncbi:hypothetical protein FQA39_LY09441 [Lamprigera yunnana]|nr:hypothetical protein FQA39_LY09441 [Lamprigera yunnana]